MNRVSLRNSGPCEIATRVAADVYADLTDSGEHPPATARTAIALHHATRELRRRRLGEPTLWAAHIHVGV